jgi:sulfide dehydrogenase cytochrome subunit
MPPKMQLFLAACLVSSGVFSVSTGVNAAVKSPASHAKSVAVNPRGEILALSCAGCHGTDGKSTGIIPSIYGKSPDYIESALKEFKSGARTSTVMGRHAKGYSDEEIHLIAQYFGTLWAKHK